MSLLFGLARWITINNESHPRLVTYRLPAVATVVSNDQKISTKMAFSRNYTSWRPGEPGGFFNFFHVLGRRWLPETIEFIYRVQWLGHMVLCESMATCCIFIPRDKYSKGLSRQIVICLVCSVHLVGPLSVAKYRWNHPEGSSLLEFITFASGTYWLAQIVLWGQMRASGGVAPSFQQVPEKQRVTKEAF